jgi:hypothetical protein
VARDKSGPSRYTHGHPCLALEITPPRVRAFGLKGFYNSTAMDLIKSFPQKGRIHKAEDVYPCFFSNKSSVE